MLATPHPVGLRELTVQTNRKRGLSDRCPVCGSTSYSVYLKGDGARLAAGAFGSSLTELATGTILRCGECGIGFSQHRPADEELGQLYREMDIAMYQAEGEGRRRTARRHLEIVSAHSDGGRLLDVGCASGVFLDRARSAGWDVTGVKPSPPLYQLARDLLDGRGKVLPLTLQEAELGSRRFDAITLWDVLEHVADPVSFLAQCRSLLKPDGFIFANVPDLESGSARLLGRRWPLLLPEHLNYFTRSSLTRCAQKAGLEVVRFGRRPASFTLSYILYLVGQHGVWGVDTMRRISEVLGIGKWVFPIRLGETFVVCLY